MVRSFSGAEALEPVACVIDRKGAVDVAESLLDFGVIDEPALVVFVSLNRALVVASRGDEPPVQLAHDGFADLFPSLFELLFSIAPRRRFLSPVAPCAPAEVAVGG